MSWGFFSAPGIASSPSTPSPATFSFWCWFRLNQNGSASTAQTIMRENGARISLQASLASGFDDLVFTRSGMTGSIVCDMSANGITADDQWVFVGLAMSGFTTLDRFVLATEGTPAFAATVTNTLAGTGFTASGIKSLGNSSASAQPLDGLIHSAGFHPVAFSLADFEAARTTFDGPSADWTYTLLDTAAPWEQAPTSGSGILTGTDVVYSADAPSVAPAPAPPAAPVGPASPNPYVPAPRFVEETIIMRGEGGQWLQIGRDAARGITHEGLTLAADRRGPTTASFTLRRDPAVSWPDLSPFNEILVEVGGVVVWSGRMREAPGQSGTSDTISVTASGWQAHLDDDLLVRGWVHSRMSEWRDGTSFPGMASNPVLPSGLVVSTEGGQPVIGWRQGEVMRDVTAPSIGLDLGPGASPITRVVIEWSMRTVNAWSVAYVRGYPNAGFGGGGSDFIAKDSATFTAGVPAVSAGSATGARSILIFLLRTGGDFAATAEHLLRFHRILLFSDAADEAGNDSALLASTVIREVATSGHLPQLSADTSAIETTAFAIPHYWPQGHQSPRELMEPVNAFHDYDLGVDVERRVFFRAPATVASMEVGPWSGAEFSDASAGSGEDVYNKVIVQAQAADGTPVEVTRNAATAAPELAISVPIAAAISNPSVETDTTGWSLTNFSRVNTAGGALGGSWALKTTASTTALAGINVSGMTIGIAHLLRVWLRTINEGAGVEKADAWVQIAGTTPVRFSNHETAAQLTLPDPSDGWVEVQIPFVPTVTAGVLAVLAVVVDTVIYVDDVSVERAEVNSVDRHGFARAARMPISAPITTAAAEVLGDVWLRNHLRTPLKGSITVTAQGGVREALGGAPVHPAHLLLRHGEVLRHAGMADPDTGAWGRNGRIASVSYSGGRAVVELDNERHRLEALIARYAAIAGGVA